MTYSIDLRQRVLDYHESGHKIKETCEIFSISRHTVYRWVKVKKETGSIAPKVRTHGAIKLNDEGLIKYIKEYPDKTLREYGDQFGLTISGMSRAFNRLGITHKKKHTI